MGSAQTVLELVAAARATAKVSEDRISEIQQSLAPEHVTDAQREDLRAATVALERAAVDLFSLFEARMQHHFRRGPFSRKLRSLLLEAGKTDLAERFHQYYLAINVLKHGKGASYRELLGAPTALVVLNPVADPVDDTAPQAIGLVDVNAPGFMDSLNATVVDAYHFFENK
ncbi:MAG: hypothetical protein ACJASZ_001567 [Yoonia sp.]|jgi:hypothetical protein